MYFAKSISDTTESRDSNKRSFEMRVRDNTNNLVLTNVLDTFYCSALARSFISSARRDYLAPPRAAIEYSYRRRDQYRNKKALIWNPSSYDGERGILQGYRRSGGGEIIVLAQTEFRQTLSPSRDNASQLPYQAGRREERHSYRCASICHDAWKHWRYKATSSH